MAGVKDFSQSFNLSAETVFITFHQNGGRSGFEETGKFFFEHIKCEMPNEIVLSI